MKKFIPLLIISCFILTLALPNVSKADIVTFLNPIQTDTFKDAVDKVVNLIFRAAIVIAPLMIVVGGFFIVTATGNAEQINKGKKIILWTIVGFVIVLLARGISDLIEIIIGV